MANTEKQLGSFVVVNRGEDYEPAVAIVVSLGNENESWAERTLGLAFLPPAQWVRPGNDVGQWSDPVSNGVTPEFTMASSEKPHYNECTVGWLKTEIQRRELVVPTGANKADLVNVLEQDDMA